VECPRARHCAVAARACPELYHQHFEAALQWATAEGRLDTSQRHRLEPLLTPSSQVAADLRVAQPVLNRVDKSRLRLYGTLLLQLEETLLLYLPAHPQPLLRFEKQADLERWLTDQQPERLQVSSLDFIEFGSDPLKRGVEPLLSGSPVTGDNGIALDRFSPSRPPSRRAPDQASMKLRPSACWWPTFPGSAPADAGA
jgi:hypothetical protein